MVQFGIQPGASSHPASGPAAERYIRLAARVRARTALTLLILVIVGSVSADASPKAGVADFGRIGSVTLGMSQKQASTAAGIELTAGYGVPADEQSCYQLYAKGEAKPKILFMMSHDKLVRYDIYDAAIRTRSPRKPRPV